MMKKNLKKVVSMVLAMAVIAAMTVFPAMAEPEQPAETAAAYTGEEITPDIAAYSAGVQLVNGTDYDLTYENNINVGTATAIVTFKGNYIGTRTVNFEIVARELSNSDVVFGTVENQIFTGSAITPEPTITYGDVTLEKDKDYTLAYENNVNVGTGKILVTFIGNFTGSAETTFEIVPKSADDSSITISAIPDQTYTGAAITPEPTVTDVNR